MRSTALICLLVLMLPVSLVGAAPTPAEQPDLDPVGTIVLQGKADPTYDQVSKFYPAMLYPARRSGYQSIRWRLRLIISGGWSATMASRR
jgi:hypothetical protein